VDRVLGLLPPVLPLGAPDRRLRRVSLKECSKILHAASGRLDHLGGVVCKLLRLVVERHLGQSTVLLLF